MKQVYPKKKKETKKNKKEKNKTNNTGKMVLLFWGGDCYLQ